MKHFPALWHNTILPIRLMSTPELARRLTEDEYSRIRDTAHRLGFVNGWQQEL